MKKFAVALGLLCMAAAAPTLRAQSPSTPQQPQQPPTVSSVLNTLYGVVEQQVVSAAEAMPEDKYGFAPTNGEFKGVRTFAEEVKHIGFANHLFFGPLMGENFDPKNIQAEANGPAAPLTIQVHTLQAGFMQRPGSAEEHRDHLGQLADAGVDSFVLRPPGDSVDHALAALHEYAETFLKR